MRYTAAFGLLVTASVSSAHAQGSTDIFVAPLRQEGRSVTIGAPVNVTRRAGYDNQPSFTPDGASLLYTSIGDAGQADTWTIRVAGGGRPLSGDEHRDRCLLADGDA